MHRVRAPGLAFVAAATLACGAVPVASVGQVGRSIGARGAASGEPPLSSDPMPAAPGSGEIDAVRDAGTEAPPQPPMPDGLMAVESAFAERRLGHVAEARAILDAANLAIGAADMAGAILRPRGGIAGIAFAGRGADGTAFFDATSGEPTGLVSSAVFNADERETPNVGSPGIFVGYSGASAGGGALYDARSRTLLAVGPATKVTKDGATAYVASEDRCTWSRWDLLTGRPVGDLERLTGSCYDPPYLATLTDDGKALIGGAWWDLDTRTIHRMPSGLVVFNGYSAAISADQNFVAYLLSASPDALAPSSFVTLVDRRTGVQRVSNEPLGTLSNGTPLSFAESPARVIVFDYGQWAFSVPSLQLLAKGGGPGPQDPALTQTPRPVPDPPPPPSDAETAPLRALLARASCTRGGFIVPLDLCASP